ncbi:MAG TPA: antitoxin Xre/MbcA/ParS toxin-binding domain-containing protein [Acidobacteriaceae bacterium]|nr:antitoxin Xre/MbcA/ParS toxin-binding domain-containing protein [Acidobacteriaceae bacterium]
MQAAETIALSTPRQVYLRIARKLGVRPVKSDLDLLRLVEKRLPVDAVESLSSHGISDQEIYSYISPRRTLAHRRTRKEPLTHEESDRAVRLARITSLAEEVFANDAKAARWLRKPKTHLDGRTPLDLAQTEAGARIVEDLLLQLEFGYTA